jgi:putative hydrolase of the HAD superfamily
MHAAKPQPIYYREILEVVGCEPSEALMVGDDWRNDIAPAAAAGLFAYWIALGDAEPPNPGLIHGRGSLDALLHRIEGGWLESLGAPGVA